ncbi:sodium/calcium exchanger protein-like [Oryza sativa Japonica Group]|uniref:Sodium/calcium exchanger protein-like n=1 Tax=Oryza sativa subsp. japonica TaxID=39947 RepID=Q5VQU0_ORYSJ|nr:sodium/calcium exchanger protein-like [Oryza sativa Japonica Group]
MDLKQVATTLPHATNIRGGAHGNRRTSSGSPHWIRNSTSTEVVISLGSSHVVEGTGAPTSLRSLDGGAMVTSRERHVSRATRAALPSPFTLFVGEASRQWEVDLKTRETGLEGTYQEDPYCRHHWRGLGGGARANLDDGGAHRPKPFKRAAAVVWDGRQRQRGAPRRQQGGKWDAEAGAAAAWDAAAAAAAWGAEAAVAWEEPAAVQGRRRRRTGLSRRIPTPPGGGRVVPRPALPPPPRPAPPRPPHPASPPLPHSKPTSTPRTFTHHLVDLLHSPLYLPRRLTISDIAVHRWSKRTAVASALLSPLLLAAITARHHNNHPPVLLTISLAGVLLAAAAAATTDAASPPKSRSSRLPALWSYVLARELVSLLVSLLEK